jgi:cadherin EGF LAG seven-pass G-type receptor 2
MNPGQGPPGLGDPGGLFLEGQDQRHGEAGRPWP